MIVSTICLATCVFVATAGVARHDERAASEKIQVTDYSHRPLQLPELGVGEECPVSLGDKDIVSSNHKYIFGAGGYFFGSGPVYFALSWKSWDHAEAYFELDHRTLRSGKYYLKTPWIMHPGYRGAALIRGARIGGAATDEILFAEHTQSQPMTANMILRSETPGTNVSDSQKRAVHAVWGFWPSSMILTGPGCYAIQIDSKDKSDIVVFEAADGE